jgi:hypothetical protein
MWRMYDRWSLEHFGYMEWIYKCRGMKDSWNVEYVG